MEFIMMNLKCVLMKNVNKLLHFTSHKLFCILGLDKILKTVKKKKDLGCILPRIIMTKLHNSKQKPIDFKNLDKRI